MLHDVGQAAANREVWSNMNPMDEAQELRRGIEWVVAHEHPTHVAFDLNVPEQAAFFVEIVSVVHGRGMHRAKEHFNTQRLRELEWWQLVFLRGLMRARRRWLATWPELKQAVNARERAVTGVSE